MTIKPQVQISLTKEQYKTLVEMVYLGHWMANATRTKTIKKYDDMEQLVFSFTKQAGLQDCIDFDNGMKMFFTLREFEETVVLPLKEDYDDYTFWDELIHRLAWRDAERKFGKQLQEGMTTAEQLKAKDAIAGEYEDEFDKNGLDNVEIPNVPQ